MHSLGGSNYKHSLKLGPLAAYDVKHVFYVFNFFYKKSRF